jgi:hypothetical protein
MHIYMCVCIHEEEDEEGGAEWTLGKCSAAGELHVCMYIYICVCIHACIYFLCMRMEICTRLCACIYGE